MKDSTLEIPKERIMSKIFLIRGKKVMIDRDLAELYNVSTKVLNQAVRRNINRFPADFMFQLSLYESEVWGSKISSIASRSQIVTLKRARGKNIKYLPYVFTEQGVAMLSSVLKSQKAIEVNIQIIRTFTQLRELLSTHKDLREKIEKLEEKYDGKIKEIFDSIKYLLLEDEKPKEPMGFV